MAKLLNMDGGKGKSKKTQKSQKTQQGKGKGKQVSIKQSKEVECKNCGYSIYIQSVHLRKIPKMLVGAPQDVLIPVDVFLCGNCGELNTELLPEEVRPFFDE